MTMPVFNADVAVYRTSLKYRCNHGPAKGEAIILSQSLPPPPGSYQISCFDCDYNPYIGNLSCQCYDFNGNPQPTSINPQLCGVDIANCNGNLVCGSCPS